MQRKKMRISFSFTYTHTYASIKYVGTLLCSLFININNVVGCFRLFCIFFCFIFSLLCAALLLFKFFNFLAINFWHWDISITNRLTTKGWRWIGTHYVHLYADMPIWTFINPLTALLQSPIFSLFKVFVLFFFVRFN